MDGGYMLDHGVPVSTNFLWQLDPHAPFTTHEPLTDLLLTVLYRFSGEQYGSMVVVSAFAMALALTIAARLSQKAGASVPLLVVAAFLAALATSIHWSCRAHLFSYVFFAMTIAIVTSDLQSFKRDLALFLNSALWTNFHCSSILSLPLLFLGNKQLLPRSCLAVLLGILCNLRGPGYFSFLTQYASKGQSLGRGSEWCALDLAYGPGIYAFLALLLLTLVVVIKELKKKRSPEDWVAAGLFIGFGAASFLFMRFIPYFAIFALSIYRGDSAKKSNLLTNPVQTALSLTSAIVIMAAFMLRTNIEDMQPDFLPVHCTNYLRDHLPARGLKSTGFCYDNWGDYLSLKSGLPFFIDDKTQTYPAEFNVAYVAALMAEPGAREFIESCHFDYAIVPRRAPLAALLRQMPHWQVVQEDKQAILFYRK